MALLDQTLGTGVANTLGNAVVSAGITTLRSLLPKVSAMMALGLFVFGLPTLPYQQLQRNQVWRHPSSSRIGKRPIRQYTGPGDDTVTLSGLLLPELTGGKVSLELLRAMANTGKAWTLIQGDGTVYGHYVIESIDEGASLFFPDGRARRIEFTVKLTRVDDDDIDMLGAITPEIRALL